MEFILTQFLQSPAMNDTCYLIDVIDECVREMEAEHTTYSEIMKIQTPLIFEDENWHEPYQDDSLSESLALTPDHMPCPKKPGLELKTLPQEPKMPIPRYQMYATSNSQFQFRNARN